MDTEVFKFEIINVSYAIATKDLQLGKGAWLTSKLSNQNHLEKQLTKKVVFTNLYL